MAFKEAAKAQPQSIQNCLRLIVEQAKPAKVVLFGSRARGEHRGNSDFDLAVFGRKCDSSAWASLLIALKEEPYTLYPIDLVEFERLGQDYQTNIQNEGIVLYESNS